MVSDVISYIQKLLIPLAYFAGSLIFGLFIEKFVLKKIQRAASRTKWKGDDVLVNSFRGIIVFWMITAGVYLSIHHYPFRESLVSAFDKILFSAVVLSGSVLAARICVGLFRLNTSGTAGLFRSSSIIANITRGTLLLIGILVVLQTLGISVTPVLTALGVGGLAVALALQETLSNLFSGIQVIASQQVRTGDYIKLDSGEEGYVSDITWRNTIIRTLPNNTVVVPNSKIASAIITNYYLPDRETAVLIDVGVSYESNLQIVEQITTEVAREVMRNVEGGVSQFEPFIRYNAFSNSSINFTVIMRGREFTNQYLLKHEFIKALHTKYRECSIEIPFPIRTVIMKSPGSK